MGGGSGKILAKVFQDFLEVMVTKYVPNHKVTWYFQKGTKTIENLKEDDIYSSYQLLLERGKELVQKKYKIPTEIQIAEILQQISIAEAQQLYQDNLYFLKQGVRTVFRTSVNAEALYEFRQQVGAVKEILLNKQDFNVFDDLSHSKTRKILLLRDQSEGYYANTSYKIKNHGNKEEIIEFKGKYSKVQIRRLVEFAKKRGDSRFGRKNYSIWASYKNHLFSNRISAWFEEFDPKIQVFQPDTGFTKLFDFINGRKENGHDNIVFITSNEIGDLVYEPFIEILKSTGEKLDLFSKSFFINPPFKGNQFVEYQNVHGSADDLFKEQREHELIPYSTLRIAAEILKKQFELNHIQGIVDKAIAKTKLHFLISEEKYDIYTAIDFIKNEINQLYKL